MPNDRRNTGGAWKLTRRILSRRRDRPDSTSGRPERNRSEFQEHLRNFRGVIPFTSMPYYDQDGMTIFHGDCREVLPQLASESVDFVLTDPPYLVGFTGRFDNKHEADCRR